MFHCDGVRQARLGARTEELRPNAQSKICQDGVKLHPPRPNHEAADKIGRYGRFVGTRRGQSVDKIRYGDKLGQQGYGRTRETNRVARPVPVLMVKQDAIRDVLWYLFQSAAQDFHPQNGMQTHDRPFGRRQPPGRIKNLYGNMEFTNIVQLCAQREQCRGAQPLMSVAKGLRHPGDTIAMTIEVKTDLICQCPKLAMFRTGRQICRGDGRACGCHA